VPEFPFSPKTLMDGLLHGCKCGFFKSDQFLQSPPFFFSFFIPETRQVWYLLVIDEFTAGNLGNGTRKVTRLILIIIWFSYCIFCDVIQNLGCFGSSLKLNKERRNGMNFTIWNRNVIIILIWLMVILKTKLPIYLLLDF